jgi:hypothetical protein
VAYDVSLISEHDVSLACVSLVADSIVWNSLPSSGLISRRLSTEEDCITQISPTSPRWPWGWRLNMLIHLQLISLEDENFSGLAWESRLQTLLCVTVHFLFLWIQFRLFLVAFRFDVTSFCLLEDWRVSSLQASLHVCQLALRPQLNLSSYYGVGPRRSRFVQGGRE